MAGNDAFAQIVPLLDEWLLLPRSAVRETRSMAGLIAITAGPKWLLGLIGRGREVPVVSLEGMAGNEIPPPSQHARLTILNSLGEQLDSGAFAVVTRGHPRLLPLDPRTLHARALRPGESGLALAGARLPHRDALIPDFERIEARIQQALQPVESGEP